MLHTSGRTDLWKHAVDDAIQNPFLGSGPMRYACEVNHYLAGSAHSLPFQIMGEWGIPAFLILGILFFWLIYSWSRAAKQTKQASTYKQVLVACTSISCLAAVIHVCVSGLLISPSSQVAGMLIVGWLLGSLSNEDNRLLKKTITRRTDPMILSLFGVMVAVSVLVFATVELDKLTFRTSYAQDYGPITPRFWQDGRFCEFSF
jgi:O-antigen ligase